jgi:hypothetical protein
LTTSTENALIETIKLLTILASLEVFALALLLSRSLKVGLNR